MPSKKRKEQVLNVDKLIVKANQVIFADEQKQERDPEQKQERDPWGFPIRRQLPIEANDEKLIGEVKEENKDTNIKTEKRDANINIEENARRRQFNPWGFPIRRELPEKENDQKMTEEIPKENVVKK
ncbi:hypothetical protein [Metabacillus sp. RGM 3146]|uniref:hypothetical protein n=1 Tax=Metabacillus sp. RGM 3146 TaxID=3401092 RepID=UPI003B9AE7FA